jgi:hypothetical protein
MRIKSTCGYYSETQNMILFMFSWLIGRSVLIHAEN